MGNFNEFLKDHASCEKKASGMALNIASHYPDRPDLLRAMTDLAVEELSHYREVVRLMIERGITPGADRRDLYVRALNQLIRQGTEQYLLDRLLIATVVERRGCERFGLIADALASNNASTLTSNDGEGSASADLSLAGFYRAITASEGRHWMLFLDLARHHCDPAAIPGRLAEVVEAEAEIMRAQPFGTALH